MLSEKKIELKNLHFDPLESVTFEMVSRKQRIPFEIRNEEDVDIIVQWKSTRPPLFTTEPNNAIVKSKERKIFKLVFKGKEWENERNKPWDRFSAVISAIKPTKEDPKQIWKQYSLRKKLFMGSRHKKFVFVVFKGINKPNWWNLPLPYESEMENIRTFGIVREEDDDDLHLQATLRAGTFQEVLVQLNPVPSNNTKNNSS